MFELFIMHMPVALPRHASADLTLLIVKPDLGCIAMPAGLLSMLWLVMSRMMQLILARYEQDWSINVNRHQSMSACGSLLTWIGAAMPNGRQIYACWPFQDLSYHTLNACNGTLPVACTFLYSKERQQDVDPGQMWSL